MDQGIDLGKMYHGIDLGKQFSYIVSRDSTGEVVQAQVVKDVDVLVEMIAPADSVLIEWTP